MGRSLWGLGLLSIIHDACASCTMAARGEGRRARRGHAELSRADRRALVQFVESLSSHVAPWLEAAAEFLRLALWPDRLRIRDPRELGETA